MGAQGPSLPVELDPEPGNELDEALSGDWTLDDVRHATTSAVGALRNDRRRVRLSVEVCPQVSAELSRRASSVRSLAHFTGPVSEQFLEQQREWNLRFDVDRTVAVEVFDAAVADPALGELIRSQGSWGSACGVATMPFRAHVYDQRVAIVAVDFDDNQAGAWLVSEPALVASLVELHRQLWRRSERSLPSGRSRSLDYLDVLARLNAGHTDEAAARNLNVSLRTYRRGVADLMERLGARDRFHVGAAAQRHGLLALLPEVA